MAQIKEFYNPNVLTEEEILFMNTPVETSPINKHERELDRRMQRDMLRRQNGLPPLEDPIALFKENILAALEDV
ncbi:hypothetical protein [Butyrivibrio sp.]|uniref:hypothetical protein n=1 Tax=Butyrivibrio sp. TaxID=28121 RepID=UPI0025BCA9FC|nr:hypothetical protein [Butyrivibrio sp.]MBQ7428378.1 hypothetical protein [Butyrivibrio sp.]MBQ9303310.1 hypothetical protein [Butyrivibrio sp.]